MLIRFWCTSLKKFRCSIFLISLKQWCRTKLRAIVSNTNYFKPFISKFKPIIYNSNSKVIHNFCMYGPYNRSTYSRSNTSKIKVTIQKIIILSVNPFTVICLKNVFKFSFSQNMLVIEIKCELINFHYKMMI